MRERGRPGTHSPSAVEEHVNFSFAAWIFGRSALRWAGCLLLAGCITRPVVQGEPTELERLASIPITSSAAIDVLLVVDDSISMGDKQRLFAAALARSLTTPTCVTPDGKPATLEESGDAGVTCTIAVPRLGMITTSLSASGNAGCDAKSRGAHLVPAPNGKPHFDPRDEAGIWFGRETLEKWIVSAGESGCGYESTLEAMYRFLIEPDPLLDGATLQVDETLLKERSTFLRPGSSVTIIFVTDEDDCSVMDTPAGAGMREDAARYRGTAVCETNAEDVCCRSCGTEETAPPEGCAALSDDTSCQLGVLKAEDDDPNVRCFDQRRRFGASYLFPLDRYVRGLTSRTVVDRHGAEVTNPLYTAGRTPEMVHLAFLTGVPWPTTATEGSGSNNGELQLLTSRELHDSVWKKLIGSEAERDPRLIESIGPRAELPGPEATRWADPIISHDYDNPRRAALQNSCVFELPEPVDCGDVEWCDCAERAWPDGAAAPLSSNNPLCQAEDGSYGSTQHFAKATPPVRLLTFAQRVNDAVETLVGSICPVTLDPSRSTSSTFGYNAFGVAVSSWFGGGGGLETMCIDARWPDTAGGRANCKLIERVQAGFDCNLPGRRVAPEEYVSWTLPPWGKRKDFTFCEVLPLPGDPEAAGTPAHTCAHALVPPNEEVGYCLIDPEHGLGDPNLVEMCPDAAKRRIRLIPSDLGRHDRWKAEAELRYVCL